MIAMKAKKIINFICCVVASAVLCMTGAGASAVGASEGAMSPRATAKSYGARLQETPLGSFVADGMRLAAGADIAIECGGHLVKALPGGTIMEEDARAVFAANLELAVVELTAAQLFDLLEYAVGFAQIDQNEQLDEDTGFDGFPQISGFSFAFDVSQKAGNRLREVTLGDGTVLSREDQLILRAVVPVDMLDGALGFTMLEGLPYEVVGRQQETLIAYIAGQGQVIAPEMGRITMVGSAGVTLYQSLKVGTWLPYVILLILLIRLPWRSKRKREMGE